MSDPYTSPRQESAAAIVIEVPRDCHADRARARVDGTEAILPAVAELIGAFRDCALPIIHVVRLSQTDDLAADPLRALLPATASLDHEALLRGAFQQVGEHEYVMCKPRWSAFFGTGLETYLRAAGIDTLVFAGCDFPNGPRASVYEASERDFRIVLASDAMSGVYDQGVVECRRIGVSVWTVGEIVKWLGAKPATV